MLILGFRQLLLYVHLFAFAFALVCILHQDVQILLSKSIDRASLMKAKHLTTWLLSVLWVTGITMIVMDTGWDVAAITSKPKLVIKITTVIVLSLNGLLLHRIAFPMLLHPQRSPRRAATTCSILGAISSVSWIFASLAGAARVIAPELTYSAAFCLYLAALSLGIILAIVAIQPLIKRKLASCIDNKSEAQVISDPPHASPVVNETTV